MSVSVMRGWAVGDWLTRRERFGFRAIGLASFFFVERGMFLLCVEAGVNAGPVEYRNDASRSDEFVVSLKLPTIVSGFDRGRRTDDSLSCAFPAGGDSMHETLQVARRFGSVPRRAGI